MKIEITATNELAMMDGNLVRRWEGVTERGVRCDVFVRLIRVPVENEQAQFEQELREQQPPGLAKVIDLRAVI